ncbi:outer membrane lipid asymmetry maintenance protein MlaD [Desulfobacterales bacterium HSG16]|nr:outer membrane lipid asymmetry maintenance protein MlaD [Desulfobacterales bacterium HSG16]
MKKKSVEISVGIFVLAGLLCFSYLAVKLGNLELINSGKYYTLSGKFASVAGLKNGADIRMSGVPVGKVSSVRLDMEEQVAVVTMKIDKQLTLSEDAIASIKTSGLIGDKYIKLTPGGADELLEDNGEILETESALDIEALISKYVFGSID